MIADSNQRGELCNYCLQWAYNRSLYEAQSVTIDIGLGGRMMTPKQVERTIESLLNHQAAHDARLAELENSIKELTISVRATDSAVKALVERTEDLTESVEGLAVAGQSMLYKFREGFNKLTTIAEQTMTAVREIAEAEVRTMKRVEPLEGRI
jgi:chromosome segregation ATPase